MENRDIQFTIDGHLSGMLDRDQRTTKCLIDRHMCYTRNININLNIYKKEKFINRTTRKWKNHYMYKILQSKFYNTLNLCDRYLYR